MKIAIDYRTRFSSMPIPTGEARVHLLQGWPSVKLACALVRRQGELFRDRITHHVC